MEDRIIESKMSHLANMNKVIRHFKVKFEEAHEPKGIATAAIRSCMCCGRVICGMGGGGEYICIDCLDKMHKGDMAEALYLLARDRDKEL